MLLLASPNNWQLPIVDLLEDIQIGLKGLSPKFKSERWFPPITVWLITCEEVTPIMTLIVWGLPLRRSNPVLSTNFLYPQMLRVRPAHASNHAHSIRQSVDTQLPQVE